MAESPAIGGICMADHRRKDRKDKAACPPTSVGRKSKLRTLVLPMLVVAVLAAAAYLVFFSQGQSVGHSKAGHRTVSQLMALSDAELEKVDLVEMNIAVAREIPGLEGLDYDHYREIVDVWAEEFLRWLPTVEHGFRENPAKYKDDIHFFHLGMLAQFLSHNVGIAYIEEQKQAQVVDRKAGKKTEILYTDPGHLLLHGLIDSKRGTCGTMPTLHVAMARRLGWPVGLACTNSHFVSRYDDGKVVYNIEATCTEGGFSEGSDKQYMEIEGVSQKAIACGSDLRKLSGREMLGVFIAARARYYNDIGKTELATRDYALAFTQMPNNRKVYLGLVGNLMDTGERLFAVNELGHPVSLATYLSDRYPSRSASVRIPEPPMRRYDPTLDVDRINAINRANRERMMQQPSVPQPAMPGGAYPQANR